MVVLPPNLRIPSTLVAPPVVPGQAHSPAVGAGEVVVVEAVHPEEDGKREK